MGKSNNTQPTHSTVNAVNYAVLPRRSVPVSMLESKLPAVDVAISSRPPSPTRRQYYDAVEYVASSPDADGDVFYELDDNSVQLVVPEPEYDGAAKGRIGRVSGPSRHAAASPSSTHNPISFTPSTFSLPKPDAGILRGPAKPAVNSPSGPATANLMAEGARKAATHDSRKPVKKALVTGINYASWDKDKRLYYAVNDARRWRKTFMAKGVEHDNIRFITDEGEMRDAPTYIMLLEQIKWLVRDAKEGDSLFFVYSGHAMITREYGPCIITADRRIFPRPVLEQELVMSIPAGVDLQVVFDCCHSAGMIGLQYCVGRMNEPASPSASPIEAPTSCAVQSEPVKSDPAPPRPATPRSHSPQQASLYGIAADVVSPSPPVTPEINMDTFGAPVPLRPHRGGAVAAAPPLAAAAGPQPEGAAAGAVRYLGSFLGLGSSSAPAPTPTPTPPALPDSRPRRACQGVVEAPRMPDYFEERKQGFVAPAAKVMVWAGTGESQKAFESHGGAKQGVVTKAMCAAFERITTRRDLWSYLVQEIQVENNKRSARDATKSVSERPLASMRIQHAELWVSQAHLTKQPSPAPVLDQPII